MRCGVQNTVVIGVPTVIIANPWFGREIPVRWWERRRRAEGKRRDPGERRRDCGPACAV